MDRASKTVRPHFNCCCRLSTLCAHRRQDQYTHRLSNSSPSLMRDKSQVSSDNTDLAEDWGIAAGLTTSSTRGYLETADPLLATTGRLLSLPTFRILISISPRGFHNNLSRCYIVSYNSTDTVTDKVK